MVIPCRGVSDSGEVARLVLRQAAHDYLHNSVVMPARELREELERFKRQKKDRVAPQDLVAGLDGEHDGEEDAYDNDEARPAGDCRPPSTKTGALFNEKFEERVLQMRANRERKESNSAQQVEHRRQQATRSTTSSGAGGAS